MTGSNQREREFYAVISVWRDMLGKNKQSR